MAMSILFVPLKALTTQTQCNFVGLVGLASFAGLVGLVDFFVFLQRRLLMSEGVDFSKTTGKISPACVHDFAERMSASKTKKKRQRSSSCDNGEGG